MKFLLVVALLIFTGSCSVSSHQYYVSDNCSSVNYTNCKPLSAYAYFRYPYYYFNGSDHSIYYFIGTSYTNYYFFLSNVHNVTLLGLSHSPSIDCGGGYFYYGAAVTLPLATFHSTTVVWMLIILVWHMVLLADNISIGNISFNNCSMGVSNSNHVMITDSTRHSSSIDCGGGRFGIWYSAVTLALATFHSTTVVWMFIDLIM